LIDKECDFIIFSEEQGPLLILVGESAKNDDLKSAIQVCSI